MTKIQTEKIMGKKLNTIFDFNEKKLIREIRVSKAIGASIYFSSKEGYLIPIELDEITNPIYKYMQQEVTIYPIDKNRVLITIMDQTSLKEAYKQLKQFTKVLEERKKLLTDSLTGLPNINQLLLSLENDNNPKIALINIDGFNEINDFYGFEIGDLYLKDIANKLLLILSESDSNDLKLYRLFSDEYAIYSNDLTEFQFLEKIKDVVLKIKHMFFEYKENKLAIFLTMGISFEKEKLLESADIALKKAKKSKRELIVFDKTIYDEKKIKEKHKMASRLLEAIKDNRIKLFYQPIYDYSNKEIKKYESLVRMIDEEGKVISPYFFLGISKKIKVYNEITKIVINQSFEKFRDNKFTFSINISLEDILHKPTTEFLILKLKNNPNIAKRLIIELLEDEGIENIDEVTNFIRNVKKYGVRIAIDDFGTGYSNFSYLLKMDIDYLKIDASLIKHLDNDKNSKKIVETINTFADKMGVKTIAEFVYNEKVFDEVKNVGIDFAQGYYIDEPRAEIGGDYKNLF
jgi:diguanylate cyclase (GGDEF)-like protein